VFLFDRVRRRPNRLNAIFACWQAVKDVSSGRFNQFGGRNETMQRPQAITVFGILNIVFGGSGLLCSPFAIAMTMFMPSQPNNPAFQLIHNNVAFRMWMIVSAVVGMVAAAVLVAAGIGLLKMKPWARKVSIVYGIYTIVTCVVGMIVNWVFMFGPMLGEARDKGGPEAIGAIGGMVGGMMGMCFGLAYPILLIIFMTRPKIRAAMEQTATPTTLQN
jgi:hypothetical protein